MGQEWYLQAEFECKRACRDLRKRLFGRYKKRRDEDDDGGKRRRSRSRSPRDRGDRRGRCVPALPSRSDRLCQLMYACAPLRTSFSSCHGVNNSTSFCYELRSCGNRRAMARIALPVASLELIAGCAVALGCWLNE